MSGAHDHHTCLEIRREGGGGGRKGEEGEEGGGRGRRGRRGEEGGGGGGGGRKGEEDLQINREACLVSLQLCHSSYTPPHTPAHNHITHQHPYHLTGWLTSYPFPPSFCSL